MKKLRLTGFLLFLLLCFSCPAGCRPPIGSGFPMEEGRTEGEDAEGKQSLPETALSFRIAGQTVEIPAYSGKPYVPVHENVPFFGEEELSGDSFESYSELDALGRCGQAVANVGKDLMPTEERGSIGQVKPSGWQTQKYDIVDGKYLYNRCHLIGYQLTGENANERNLITGTRSLNVEGMLPFENMVADYIKETGNHVLYRVTPVFEGEELVARGVFLEGKSVEDKGEAILFCVYAYNVQPGVVIDYETGDSRLAGEPGQDDPEEETGAAGDQGAREDGGSLEESYILNTNTHTFHLPSCSSVSEMKEENRKEFTGSREALIGEGYSPGGRCKP